MEANACRIKAGFATVTLASRNANPEAPYQNRSTPPVTTSRMATNFTVPDSKPPGTAFGCARDFLDHELVYTVVSPRARGLSVGVNMNPDQFSSFDCLYCDVNRVRKGPPTRRDVDVMIHGLAL